MRTIAHFTLHPIDGQPFEMLHAAHLALEPGDHFVHVRDDGHRAEYAVTTVSLTLNGSLFAQFVDCTEFVRATDDAPEIDRVAVVPT